MATQRVIFVHGISATVLDDNYALELRKGLLKELEKSGVLHPGMSQTEIDAVITFDTINYSAIGQTQEERVLEAYIRDRDRLYNFLDQLIERAVFDRIRREMIVSVSDVLVYQSEFWRNNIRSLLVDRIHPYINAGDPVSLVGHSLGSVVAFDVAYYNTRHNPDWKQAGFKLTNLFTLGSPIALFTMELEDDSGQQKPRYLPFNATPPELNPANTNPDLHIVLPEGVWYNFLDAQDLIAYPLQTIFKDKFRVEDILVQTGTEPIKAHSGYWNNPEVIDRIARRLKLDHERLRSKEGRG